MSNTQPTEPKPSRRLLRVIIAVVCCLVIAIAAIATYASARHTKPTAPGHISNVEKHEANQQSAEGQSSQHRASPEATRGNGGAHADTIDSRLDAIESKMNAMITGGWDWNGTGQREKELAKLGVTIDWPSMTQQDGKRVFLYGDSTGQAYAGWLQAPVTCSRAGSDYTCIAKGDYGAAAKLRAEVSADHVDEIHDYLATVAHGEAGSEREIKPFKFKLHVSSDRKTAKLSLLNKELFLP